MFSYLSEQMGIMVSRLKVGLAVMAAAILSAGGACQGDRLIVACGDQDRIVLAPAADTIEVGGEGRARATAHQACDTTQASLVWSVSDTSIIRLIQSTDTSAAVSGVRPGRARLTAALREDPQTKAAIDMLVRAVGPTGR